MAYVNEIFFFLTYKIPYLGLYKLLYFEQFQLVQILTQYSERNFRNTVGVCAKASKKKKVDVYLRPHFLTQKFGVDLKI